MTLESGTPAAGALVFYFPDSSFQVTDRRGMAERPPRVDSLHVTVARLTGATRHVFYGPWSHPGEVDVSLPDSVTSAVLPGVFLTAEALLPVRSPRVVNGAAQGIVLGRENIDLLQPFSAADVLAELPGVYVQRSQFGGGSPVLRGFEANRVLLVVDDVRLNNAIYRGGHLQNSITVDPLALAKVEAIFGAGSLNYGSDALGGVIRYTTERARFLSVDPQGTSNKRGARKRVQWLDGEARVGYASAARAGTTGIKLAFGGPRFGSLTIASVSSASHLRAGAHRPTAFPDFGLRTEYLARIDGRDSLVRNADPNRQIGTAYRQYNLLQKFRFDLGRNRELGVNFQASTTSDIPRYDALTERRDGQLRWARWDYGPQLRLLGSVQYRDLRQRPLHDVLQLTIAQQRIGEDRIRRRRDDVLEEHNEERVDVTNLRLSLSKSHQKFLFRYGFDARRDGVRSTAYHLNIAANNLRTDDLATRYPSAGNRLLTAGAFLDVRRPFLSPRLRGRAGLRYEFQHLRSRFGADDPIDWPADYVEGITLNNGALTGALGLTYSLPRLEFNLLFAQGFRSPNLDDFAKFRERNGFLSIPNPDLRPERSNTLELTARNVRPWRGLTFATTVYRTWLQDAITRQPGRLPDGSTELTTAGENLRLQTNVNADRARLLGLDVQVDYSPAGRRYGLSTSFHFLEGERDQRFADNLVLPLPQDHIPPAYGQGELRYRAGQRRQFRLRAYVRYQLAKDLADYAVSGIDERLDGNPTVYVLDRTGTSDNLEFTPRDAAGNFTGTYGWWTLNLAGEWVINPTWTVWWKGENLLDRHYRGFGSGVSAAGRDLGVGVRVRW